MKLGVFTTLLADMSLKDTIGYLKGLGVQMIEVGCAGFPGTAHADAKKLVQDEKALEEFKETIKEGGLPISALSCHANPIHPDKEIAADFDEAITNTILLAEKLGIHQINTFSGCAGDSPSAKHPNWVTCPWPPEYLDILDYQWKDVLIPYWKEKGAFAKDHGVDKIALELHPGFMVYNTETMLRLRDAVGDVMGANLDPSHLFWQGMDPVAVIRELGPAIYHFHAKDTKIDRYNTAVNGVLDTKHYGDEINRSWIFRTMGYGHGADVWNEITSALRMVGYDYAVSIEHEDSLMSNKEGLSKAIKFLQEALIFEGKGEMFWA